MERLRQERTSVVLDDVRRAALSAWRAGGDGTAFVAALRARGLDLRGGAQGAGRSSRRERGRTPRDPIDRGCGAPLSKASASSPLMSAGGSLACIWKEWTMDLAEIARRLDSQDRLRTDRGGAGTDTTESEGSEFEDLVEGAGGPDGGRGRRDLGRARAALGRLLTLPPGRGMILRRRLSTLDPRATLASRFGTGPASRSLAWRWKPLRKERAWALWGVVDIWASRCSECRANPFIWARLAD